MRVLIAMLVWACAIAGAAELSSVVASSIHTSPAGASGSSGGSSGSGGSTGSGASTGSGGAPFDASSVRATDSRSLFRTANLARALALVRAHYGAGAKLDLVAIYPGYASLTVVRGGSEIDVYVDAVGAFRPTNTGGNPGALPLFSLSRVQAAVPAALARRIEMLGHVAESQLNYMVAEVDPSDGHFRWLVYPLHGNRVEYFQAPGASGQLLEYRTNSSTGLQPVGG